MPKVLIIAEKPSVARDIAGALLRRHRHEPLADGCEEVAAPPPRFSPRLGDIQKRHYTWLAEMGWTTGTTPLEQIALIASEIGEAANECRGKKPTDKLGSELADIILRTLGLAQRLGINMEAEIAAKMVKNAARGAIGRLK